MKKIIIYLFASLILLSGLSAQSTEKKFNLWGSGDTFKLSPVTDGILLESGSVFAGTSFLCSHLFDSNKATFDGNILDKSDVNELDQLFMQPYSKKLDLIGTASLIAALSSPAILALTPTEEWMTVGTMYLESLFFAFGLKEFSKYFITRARPYMYYSNYPQEKVDDGDWCKSFPSGHTTLAFTGASFASYVFCKYFPDNPWRWAVVGTSYLFAVGTGVLRICSGNHFLTDVLTGATIGTIAGFVIPWIHTFNANSKSKDKTARLEISPLSLGLVLNF
ncbi:MAG: phosphatase PAP2 family protein [Treponema sp.]|nr:phosphatase PAP2 family protein [Treponema sp.]